MAKPITPTAAGKSKMSKAPAAAPALARALPYLETTIIDSFRDFVDKIELSRAAGTDRCWYRGCGRASYPLKPSLYRHKIKKTIEACIQNEGDLFQRFSERSIPFHDRRFNSQWETLFFMQHHGVPTRLLDWTENPFVALFFAATSARSVQQDDGTYTFSDDACVWVLRPREWNKAAIDLNSYDGSILTPSNSLTDSHKPGVECGIMGPHPIAIYGSHNSQRIVAQRGAFVIFGKNVEPMEKIHETHQFPRSSLKKLVLPKDKIAGLLEAITLHGITDSVVFPDLDGLAREIKREFFFPI
jgi:hypothetical protein